MNRIIRRSAILANYLQRTIRKKFKSSVRGEQTKNSQLAQWLPNTC